MRREIQCDHYGGVAGIAFAGMDRVGSVRGSQEGGTHCGHDEVCEDRRRQSYTFP